MYEDISIKESMDTLKRTHKWKSHGIDKITSTNDEIYFRNCQRT